MTRHPGTPRFALVAKALLALGSMAAGTVAVADEAFCRPLPRSDLRYQYRPAGDQITLAFSVPAKYRDAEFHYAEIQIGDDPDNTSILRFNVGMVRTGNTFSTKMTLPRKHPLLQFRALYFGKECLRELTGSFRNSGRIG